MNSLFFSTLSFILGKKNSHPWMLRAGLRLCASRGSFCWFSLDVLRLVFSWWTWTLSQNVDIIRATLWLRLIKIKTKPVCNYVWTNRNKYIFQTTDMLSSPELLWVTGVSWAIISLTEFHFLPSRYVIIYYYFFLPK